MHFTPISSTVLDRGASPACTIVLAAPVDDDGQGRTKADCRGGARRRARLVDAPPMGMPARAAPFAFCGRPLALVAGCNLLPPEPDHPPPGTAAR